MLEPIVLKYNVKCPNAVLSDAQVAVTRARVPTATFLFPVRLLPSESTQNPTLNPHVVFSSTEPAPIPIE